MWGHLIYIIGALLLYSGIAVAEHFTVRVVFMVAGIHIVLIRLVYTSCKKHVIRCPQCKSIFSVMQKKGFRACPICGMPIPLDVNKNK